MEKISNFEKCFCGNKEYNVFRDFGEKKVLECSACGLLRSAPLPHKSVCDDSYQNLNEIQRLHAHQLFVLKQMMMIAKTTDAKILDIGCSVGNMMTCLIDEGYSNVHGIEMNDYAVQVCIEKGLNVKKMDTENMEVNEKYDIIYMNHVLEHIENLNNYFSQIKQILSPGAFVVIAVPNIGGHKTEKNDWIGYQFEQHYWHFTPESLSKIFLQNDFSVHSEFTLSGGKVKSLFYKMFNLEGDSLITVFRYEK